MSPAFNAGFPASKASPALTPMSFRRWAAYSFEASSLDRQFVELRIGIKPGAVLEGEFFGFDEMMNVFRAAEAHSFQVITF